MSFYFITGLPRSRTAWLSNYLTHGPSFCFHDELLDGPQVLVAKMRQTAKRFKHVGHSDPANLFYWRQLKEAFRHEAKWVLVCNSVENSVASLSRIVSGDLTGPVRQMFDVYCDLANNDASPLLEVSFPRIDEHLTTIEQFLFGNHIVPPERRALLQKFNVQIEASQLQAGIEAAIHKGGLPWVP